MKQRRTLIIAMALLTSTFGGKAIAGCGIDNYIGSICVVGFNFCPRNTADAAGQLLSISQNTALFSLLGTTYGGDGRTTFGLPDLRGRVMIGYGNAPPLSNFNWGQRGGAETVTLTQAQLPSHTHVADIDATTAIGDTDSPSGAVPARMPRNRIYNSTSDGTKMPVTVNNTGGGQPAAIRDPYLAIKVCIVTQGVFPSRN